jgi:hypothetical protein
LLVVLLAVEQIVLADWQGLAGLPRSIYLAAFESPALALAAFLYQEDLAAGAALPGKTAESRKDEPLPESHTLRARALLFAAF